MGDYKPTGHVAAAAKLVLQDLDPEARNKRQDFMSSPPKMSLTIHAKKIKNFSKTFFKTSSFAGVQELMLYLKISAQDQFKTTKPGEVYRERPDAKQRRATTIKITKQDKPLNSISEGNAEIIIDQIKGFTLDINRRKDSPDNILLFELLNIESGNKKTIESVAESAVQRSRGSNPVESKKATLMGHYELNLWELKKESRDEKTVPIKFKDQKICDVDVEFLSQYGNFGYGYSHQLTNLSDKSTCQQIEESVLFRLPGLDERKGFDECLLPAHIGHPEILKISDPASIGSGHLRSQLWSLSEDSACFLSHNTRDCITLQNLIKKRGRLAKMKKEYERIPHRSERIKYLRETLLNKTRVASAEDTPDPLDETMSEKRKSEMVRKYLDNVTPLMEMAGGIKKRGSRAKAPDAFQRESDMKKCLDIETENRRVSTMSNFDGSPFQVGYLEQPVIRVGEMTRDLDGQIGSEEDVQEERAKNFLAVAAQYARKSISGMFKNSNADENAGSSQKKN